MKTSFFRRNAMIVIPQFVALGLFSVLMCFSASAQERATDNSLERSRISSRSLTRRVFVHSKALLVSAAVVEEKLLKQPEFARLGFAITREEADADLILELRHDVLTKYVFTVVDTRTQTVVAGGKVSSLGGTVGEKVAKRFVRTMAANP